MNNFKRLNFKHNLIRLRAFIQKGPKIKSHDIKIGRNVLFGRNVRIEAKRVRIGDGCIIKDNVRICGENFEIGDYGTIYHDCFFPGGDVSIGHNFWLGTGSIIDGRAGTLIGNNVGIGAHSQLWTHMLFGDVMMGCRFHSQKSLKIGNDVWLAGHNLVSPINIEDRSLAMFGSLLTKDMKMDKTYAGCPAKDVTEKIGSQFNTPSEHQKLKIMETYLEKFATLHNIKDFTKFAKIYINRDETFTNSEKFQINLLQRTYKKTGKKFEYYLIRHLLPDVKLLPSN
jgi:acetyltransferase-like isoleucine patch superfamily enzyme